MVAALRKSLAVPASDNPPAKAGQPRRLCEILPEVLRRRGLLPAELVQVDAGPQRILFAYASHDGLPSPSSVKAG